MISQKEIKEYHKDMCDFLKTWDKEALKQYKLSIMPKIERENLHKEERDQELKRLVESFERREITEMLSELRYTEW